MEVRLSAAQLTVLRPKIASAFTATLVESDSAVTLTVFSPSGSELDRVTVDPDGHVRGSDG